MMIRFRWNRLATAMHARLLICRRSFVERVNRPNVI